MTLRALIEDVTRPAIPKQFVDDDCEVLANPTSHFVIGAPADDAGLMLRIRCR